MKRIDEDPRGPPGALEAVELRGAPRVACCSKEGICVSLGVLGHVDSGKTSLCRALSQIISTCGLDKHPQSKERGITLDLGFSAFPLTLPSSLHRCSADKYNLSSSTAVLETGELRTEAELEGGQLVQVCLVDCPGHASLVKTVIGGAHIIDAALLVLDAAKGVQAQTAECITICQVIRKPIVVVLNKTDLLPAASRDQKASLSPPPSLSPLSPSQLCLCLSSAGVSAVDTENRETIMIPQQIKFLTEKMRRLLEGLGFGSMVPVVAVSAAPSADEGAQALGIEGLHRALNDLLLSPSLGSAQGVPQQQRRGRLPAEGEGRCLLLEALNRQRCSRCSCCISGGFATREAEPLLFFSDHAFAVKGKGTVVTGTLLRGRVGVGDTLTFVSSSTAGVVAAAARVKGIQRFRRETAEARSGQRAAVCLSGVDATHLERGLLATPVAVPPVFKACIASVRLIKIFQLPVESGGKFHCTLGHLTVLGTVHLFGLTDSHRGSTEQKQEEPQGLAEPLPSFDNTLVYEERRRLDKSSPEALALLCFERAVLAPIGSLLLGSRLDLEASLSMCRLAFEGRILRAVSAPHQASGGGPGSNLQGRGSAAASAAEASKGQRAAAPPSAAAGAAAAPPPVPMGSLRVVRRKWRVGAVERFAAEGSCPPCTCSSKPSALVASSSSAGFASKDNAGCCFRSSALVARGLFKDAQHARRFAGFRVALVEVRKEEAEKQLEREKDSWLYRACMAVCLPSLAATQGPSTSSPAPQPDAASGRISECTAGPQSDSAEDDAAQRVLVRPATITAAFGGKGKCHVYLQSPLACAEAATSEGLSPSHFCVILFYCKSCFDKTQPLLQP
ncbi:hypothetical protein Esti_005739 [Eimeria stiedai]